MQNNDMVNFKKKRSPKSIFGGYAQNGFLQQLNVQNDVVYFTLTCGAISQESQIRWFLMVYYQPKGTLPLLKEFT